MSLEVLGILTGRDQLNTRTDFGNLLSSGIIHLNQCLAAAHADQPKYERLLAIGRKQLDEFILYRNKMTHSLALLTSFERGSGSHLIRVRLLFPRTSPSPGSRRQAKPTLAPQALRRIYLARNRVYQQTPKKTDYKRETVSEQLQEYLSAAARCAARVKARFPSTFRAAIIPRL